jgi:nucleotidyltransferase/DNA polymerase involved in DNA repair
LHKPDGLTFINASDLPQKLYQLKLRDLPGIGRNMEARLLKLGIGDLQTICNLDTKQMRKAWGSIWGERMWYYLRGVELPDEETERSTIGHPSAFVFLADRNTGIARIVRGRRQARWGGVATVPANLNPLFLGRWGCVLFAELAAFTPAQVGAHK